MITTKPLRLIPVESKSIELSRVYKYIRDEQYNQYLAMNLAMNLLHTNLILENYNSGSEKKLEAQIEKIKGNIAKAQEKMENAKTDKAKEKQEELMNQHKEDMNELIKQYELSKEKRSNIDEVFNDMYIKDLYTVLQSQVNLQNKDNMSLITQRVKKDFGIALKNGMARGERSLTRYKRDYPLLTRGRDLYFYAVDEDVYVKWIKGIIFKVVLGRKDKNYKELQHTLNEIISNQNLDDKKYKICDSSIEFNEKKLMLNLAVDVKTSPKKDFIEGRVVGVDLGIAIPAYVSLSDVHYIKKGLGSDKRLIDTTLQMKDRLKRMRKNIDAMGGNGRKRKLESLENLKEKESNFRKSYQHKISKDIIDFAIKNKAGQINMEFLSLKESEDSFILQNWGYYQLQQMVEYKANREGIVVRYVDPYLTSQTCSKCGHYEEGQRENQEKFICKSCCFEANADYNASRNIAMSDKYISSKEESEYYKRKKRKEEEELELEQKLLKQGKTLEVELICMK